mgnify:CR=1 FL=1
MAKDTTAYIAMAIFGAVAVCIMLVGVVTGRTTLGMMGLVFAVYPMMIGISISVKKDLRLEIEELRSEIRALRESLKGE